MYIDCKTPAEERAQLAWEADEAYNALKRSYDPNCTEAVDRLIEKKVALALFDFKNDELETIIEALIDRRVVSLNLGVTN